MRKERASVPGDKAGFRGIVCFLVRFLFVVVLLAGWTSCSRQQSGSQPADSSQSPAQLGTTYAHYPDHFVAQSEQLYYGRPEVPHVLSVLGLKKGDVVGDIGCGVGSFTFPIAQAVGPTGKVYAVDIQAKMIEVVQRHMADPKENPYGNVIALVSRVDSAMIPPGTLDVVWLSQVHFHNFPNLLDVNRRMIQSVFESLKPGGRLVIGDETSDMTPDPAPQIARHYREAGFILEKGPERDPLIATTLYLWFHRPAR